jgi:hypothetical protein
LRTTFQPVQCSRPGRKNEICLTLCPPAIHHPMVALNDNVYCFKMYTEKAELFPILSLKKKPETQRLLFTLHEELPQRGTQTLGYLHP